MHANDITMARRRLMLITVTPHEQKRIADMAHSNNWKNVEAFQSAITRSHAHTYVHMFVTYVFRMHLNESHNHAVCTTSTTYIQRECHMSTQSIKSNAVFGAGFDRFFSLFFVYGICVY